jgi:hypothetical protein
MSPLSLFSLDLLISSQLGSSIGLARIWPFWHLTAPHILEATVTSFLACHPWGTDGILSCPEVCSPHNIQSKPGMLFCLLSVFHYKNINSFKAGRCAMFTVLSPTSRTQTDTQHVFNKYLMNGWMDEWMSTGWLEVANSPMWICGSAFVQSSVLVFTVIHPSLESTSSPLKT